MRYKFFIIVFFILSFSCGKHLVQWIYSNHTSFVNTLYQPVSIKFYNRGIVSKSININAHDSVVNIDKGDPAPAFISSDSVVLSFGNYKKVDRYCGRLPMGDEKTACFNDSANLLDIMQYTYFTIPEELKKRIFRSRYVIGAKDSLEAVNGQ